MTEVTETIDVDVDVNTAYNQWTQFETFPEFMDNVSRVEQLDDTTLRWTTDIYGVERQFETDITEQKTDERIAWRTREGETRHAGVVTFHRKDDTTARVALQLEYEPSDFAEKAADAMNVVERSARKDLENFKRFIEARGSETGAWRGEVG